MAIRNWTEEGPVLTATECTTSIDTGRVASIQESAIRGRSRNERSPFPLYVQINSINSARSMDSRSLNAQEDSQKPLPSNVRSLNKCLTVSPLSKCILGPNANLFPSQRKTKFSRIRNDLSDSLSISTSKGLLVFSKCQITRGSRPFILPKGSRC